MDAFTAYFKVTIRYSSGQTEVNHGKHQSRYHNWFFPIQVQIFTALLTYSITSKEIWGSTSGLRQVLYSVARILRSQVSILLGAWMCVCVSLCCVVLCVGRGLASDRSPVQGVLPIV
jgi:hypothetical protein